MRTRLPQRESENIKSKCSIFTFISTLDKYKLLNLTSQKIVLVKIELPVITSVRNWK